MAKNIINVEALRQASSRLLEIEESTRSLAVNIQNCAQELRAAYNDAAGTAYVQKMELLDSDFQKMIAMIDEHGQELSATATDVENVLNEGVDKANALPTDVITR